MSKPFPYIPDACYHATRRCRDGRFLIKPGFTVNLILRLCLFLAARKYEMKIHAFCFMSNHYHIVATDPGQNLPGFLTYLNSQITRVMNIFCRRRGPLWETESCPKYRVLEKDQLLETIAYIISNPVRAGLVASPRDWPGLISLPWELDGRELRVPVLGAFFNPDRYTEYEVLRLTMPPLLEDDLTREEYLEEVHARVARRVRHAHAELSASGRRFMGVKKVLEVSRKDRPAKPPSRRGGESLVSCRDPERRKRLIEALKRFQRDYREAFEAFREGKRDVVFPHGTFKMKRDSGVECDSHPLPGLVA